MSVKYYLGIDIGGTKCAIILGDKDFNIYDRISFATEKGKGYKPVIERLYIEIEKLLTNHNITTTMLYGIGISCGGPLDGRKGVILSPPNLPGWDNVPVVRIFEERFKVKTRLRNDADACALAEWKYGAGKGFDNVIFLTFGTGFGAGMILNGRLYSGASNMAGEIGHIRLAENGPVGYGKTGSAEGFCSGGGIAQLGQSKVLEKIQVGEKVSFCSGIDELPLLNAKIIGDAAEAGDELAKEIYRISGYYLGKGLSILIDLLNPELIIIGSIFARSRNLLWPAAQEVIQKECLSISNEACKIVPSGLGEKIGDFAALVISMEDF